jgi:hypothetical protein
MSESISGRTRFPIVGARHRPPAVALINALPVGAPLTVIAEPENQYDPNAIAVWLYTKDLPEASREALKETGPQSGWPFDKIMAQEVFHLGYIPKELAAELKASGAIRDNEPVDVTFAVNASGQPRVLFTEAPIA